MKMKTKPEKCPIMMGNYFSVNDGDRLVAVVKTESDAREIVRRWNAYEGLMDACKAADRLYRETNVELGLDLDPRENSVIGKIRKALAACGKEQV